MKKSSELCPQISRPVVTIPHALVFWCLVLGANLPALPASMGAVSSALRKPLLASWGLRPPHYPTQLDRWQLFAGDYSLPQITGWGKGGALAPLH